MILMKKPLAILVSAMLAGCAVTRATEEKWTSLFNGKDLSGWTPHGKATWSVQDGVLVGIGGMGHIYTDATATDL